MDNIDYISWREMICLGVVLLMRSTMGYDRCSVQLDDPCIFHLISILEQYAIATTLRIQGDLTATFRYSSEYALHRACTLRS